MNIPEKVEPVNERALAEWQAAKFGLFIHWGLYAVPAGIWKGEEIDRLGEQIQRHARIAREEYAELAEQFNPVRFDAREVARLAKNAGMKYIVFTAKHHDGFCMFKSAYTDFNVVDATPYGKDILAELADACAAEGLKLGVYYSNPDWNYPGAVSREPENQYAVFEPFTPEHLAFSCNQLRELLTNYGPIFEVFFDMGLPTLEESVELARTVHACQPDCLVSGRVMNNQGDFLTLPDNHIPANPIEQAWETPCTLYHTWGYKSWIEHPPLEQQLKKQLTLLSQVVAQGGNYLLNIGPMGDGAIQPYEREVLEKIGDWMKVNGEAIHGTRQGPFHKLPWGQATCSDQAVYLHVHEWPENGELRLPELTPPPRTAERLAPPGPALEASRTGMGPVIVLPDTKPAHAVTVLRCVFEEALPEEAPTAQQTDADLIVVGPDVECSEGFYNSLQYSTLVPDVRKQWEIRVTLPGEYELEMDYVLPEGDMPVVFSIDGQSLPVVLEGDALIDRIEPDDGNEEVLGPASVPAHHLALGRVQFTTAGRKALVVVKDAAQIADDGTWTEADIRKSPHRGPWCLNETWTGHRRYFARASMMGLEIRSIRLRNLHPQGVT